ncbi:MAG: ATP-dependent zinc metalloprotease FtsH [Candidatus Azosocius agrarius]|nr:MAG: ATP-dependent zinc metalloprotease FtsH [Gammaproteobacteria bacterium]
MSDWIKNLVLWSVIGLILVSLFSSFGNRYNQPRKLTYTQFVDKVQTGDIKEITIDNRFITGMNYNEETFSTYAPAKINSYIVEDWIKKHKIDVKGKPPEQQSMLTHIFISWFPIILFIGIWVFFMRQMQGGSGGKGAMTFGRSRAKLIGEDDVKVTFADVAGIDEAKEEVAELVYFLREPDKFRALGGRIPSGVLLVGHPGTGKTLLAKAIAGEAKVPFFTISGSEFVEMFVGVGASRVRDMFDQAKKRAPCIIFIDEIDAVGRHRGAGLGGGHDEREQTLNQLLVEMDGFEGNEGVIIIAATNRPDVLDPALLRPGRFDRQVTIGLPDLLGREKILKVHIRKVPIDKDVNIKIIARGTPGFSGADLENLVNEAALYTAKDNETLVKMHQFEKAKDKLLMGVERKSLAMSDLEKKITAYHESGHVIVGLNMPEQDPVYKVTIIPRANALGVTLFLPEYDRYSNNRTYLESQVSVFFGGRIAEELVFGKEKVTIGASNDIHRATEICRNMVTKWGLSDVIGPITIGDNNEEVFLGHQVSKQKGISEYVARQVDEEINSIIHKLYNKSKLILERNIDKLHKMAEELLKYETLDAEQIKCIMDGKDIKPPKGWDEN